MADRQKTLRRSLAPGDISELPEHLSGLLPGHLSGAPFRAPGELGGERMSEHRSEVNGEPNSSATGTRTRLARVRAEYPSQLDYSGFILNHL